MSMAEHIGEQPASIRGGKAPLKLGNALAALLVVVLLACTSAATPTPIPTPMPTATPEPATGVSIGVLDGYGRNIQFKTAPKRIVSYSSALTETIFALGLGDRLVGRDAFSDYPPQAQQLPEVGDAFGVNLERIVELEPDLALFDFEHFVPQVEALDIKVLYLDLPEDLEGVFSQILLFGRIMDAEKEAVKLVDGMRARLEALGEKVKGLDQGPRIYYELDPLLFTVGPDTFIGSLFEMLKTANIAAGAQNPFPQLGPEVVIEEDPQIILLGDSLQFGNGEETLDTLKARVGWSDISAVRGGRVHPVDADLISRPGPRVIEGLESLAKVIYPGLFQ